MARRRLTPGPVARRPGMFRARNIPRAPTCCPRLSPTAPIARVAAEAAGAAALQELTESVARARETGRMVLDLPLDAIAPDHLTRDRLPAEDEEMARPARLDPRPRPAHADRGHAAERAARRRPALRADLRLAAAAGAEGAARRDRRAALRHRPGAGPPPRDRRRRLCDAWSRRTRSASGSATTSARGSRRSPPPAASSRARRRRCSRSSPPPRARSARASAPSSRSTTRSTGPCASRRTCPSGSGWRSSSWCAPAAATGSPRRSPPPTRATPEAELAALAALVARPPRRGAGGAGRAAPPGVALESRLSGRTLTLRLKGEGVTPELARPAAREAARLGRRGG